MPEVLLKIQGLMKQFGAITATDNLNLELHAGELHALIGPNGSGKTTAINQLAGELKPNAGTILFAGVDITQVDIQSRVHLGLARSYQITSIFENFTVRENVALAVQACAGHSYRFWRPVKIETELNNTADDLIAQVGLSERTLVMAGKLAHGEKRQLEIAMALASKPRLLLLDEPMAGMGPEESKRLVEYLASIKGQLSILLVEHDMDAVFSLADRVSVLANGSLIDSGTPEYIKNSAPVKEAYLGEEVAA